MYRLLSAEVEKELAKAEPKARVAPTLSEQAIEELADVADAMVLHLVPSSGQAGRVRSDALRHRCAVVRDIARAEQARRRAAR